MKCPDYGSEMVKLKGNGRFECKNESCPVIEVRAQKRKGGGHNRFPRQHNGLAHHAQAEAKEGSCFARGAIRLL